MTRKEGLKKITDITLRHGWDTPVVIVGGGLGDDFYPKKTVKEWIDQLLFELEGVYVLNTGDGHINPVVDIQPVRRNGRVHVGIEYDDMIELAR
jgi:hypothetical protein